MSEPQPSAAVGAERYPVGVYIAGKIALAFALLLMSAGLALSNPEGAYAPRSAFYIVGVAFVVWGASAAGLRTAGDLVRYGWFQVVFDAVLVTALVALTNGVDSPLSVLYFINIIAAPFLLPAWGVVAVLAVDAVGLAAVGWAGHAGLLPWLASSHRSLAYDDIILHVFAMALVGTLSVNLTRTVKGMLEREVRQGQALVAERAMLMDELDAGTLEVGLDGRVVGLNPVLERVLGDVVGVPIEDVLPGAGSTWEVVVDLDDKPLHLLCSRHPRIGGGTLVLAQDVTRLREMEDAVARDERLAAVGKLAAGLAHEIRNPLASLSGSIQLMREEDGNPLHAIALREVQRLDQLVEEFLDTARPPRLEVRPTDLGAVIDDVVVAFRNDPRYRDRTDIDVDIEAGIATVPADPERVRQVLWNLLLNAAQAMPDQGSITVVVRQRADHLEIRVVDTGVGISPGQLRKIFDPFFTTRSGGTGLGLANVERIVRAHGGHVSVYSKPGQGTSFMLCFPLDPKHVDRSSGAFGRADDGADEVIEVDG